MGTEDISVVTKVKNWLAELALGAKAASKSMNLEREPSWKYNIHCYDDVVVDGVVTVIIHGIKELAEVTGLELKHRDFVDGDYYYKSFEGEDFIMFNDVKFTDLIMRKDNDT